MPKTQNPLSLRQAYINISYSWGPGKSRLAAFDKYRVLPYHDSLIGKLIVHANNRDLAISRIYVL